MKHNVKFLKLLIIATATTSAFADNSTVNQLTSTLQANPAVINSSKGNLVNSNVNYNNTGSNKVINVSGGVSNGQECPQTINTNCADKPKPRKHYRKKSSNVTKKSNSLNPNSWAYQSFDVSYHGDLSGIPDYLKQFDPSLVILPSIGKKKPYDISFDIQSAKITDIVSTVNEQTNNGAKLIYDNVNDSIRIAYSNNVDYSYGNDALQQSIDWQNGLGKPKPIMGPDGMILFPYGLYAPIITCKPMQVCDIAFDKGEHLTDANIGDNQQWVVGTAISGSGVNAVEHLIIKPWYDNLSTNLIVATDKGRNYAITLRSSNTNYISLAGFYYPQQLNNMVDQKLTALKNQLINSNDYDSPNNSNLPLAKSSSSSDDELAALKIDKDYKISGDSPIWKPINVFNDGVHTFIQLPDSYLNSSKSPILLGMDDSGNYQILNYRVKGNYYITDVVFDRAVMVDDINNKGDVVYITHKGTPVFKNWLF